MSSSLQVGLRWAPWDSILGTTRQRQQGPGGGLLMGKAEGDEYKPGLQAHFESISAFYNEGMSVVKHLLVMLVSLSCLKMKCLY